LPGDIYIVLTAKRGDFTELPPALIPDVKILKIGKVKGWIQKLLSLRAQPLRVRAYPYCIGVNV